MHRSENFEDVAARHHDIEQRDIDVGARQLERQSITIAALGNDNDVALARNVPADDISRKWLVVGDEKS